MKKYIGIALVIIGLVVLIFVLYSNSKYSGYTRTFSSYTLLKSSWENYKKQYISKDGRVIDHSQESITTSEGQSYALLRAVWIDDKATFDQVWTFTKDNMKRKDDHLSVWKWGKLADNKYGPIDENAATDADSDIAYALILAGRRWSNDTYTAQSKEILNDLWSIGTEELNGKRYFLAGNWARTTDELVLNPSYFSPYAWRVFAEVDTKHDWKSLISPAYEVLRQASAAQLDKSSSIGLPPDWVAVDRKNGSVKSPTLTNLTSNYSYDAMRTPWRIALDYLWYRDSESYDYLKSLKPLNDFYVRDKKLFASYSHDGATLENYENPSMYATALAYFKVVDPKMAESIYQDKILSLYSTDKSGFKTDIAYYEQNWLWFGAALYTDSLSFYK